MVKIALITEGITDQYIIRPIVENYFDNLEFVFNPISPSVDETDKQTGFGSWTNVFNACKIENFEEIFLYNDYVIIHIDADISYTTGFDIPHSENGISFEHETLCNKIILKLQNLFPKHLYEKYSDKFLFAIGILTIECWLIAVLNPHQNKNETNNCLFKLNKLLIKKNLKPINPKDKNNFSSKLIYKKLASNFKNKSQIEKYSKFNIGFRIFINQLSKMKFNNN